MLYDVSLCGRLIEGLFQKEKPGLLPIVWSTREDLSESILWSRLGQVFFSFFITARMSSLSYTCCQRCFNPISHCFTLYACTAQVLTSFLWSHSSPFLASVRDHTLPPLSSFWAPLPPNRPGGWCTTAQSEHERAECERCVRSLLWLRSPASCRIARWCLDW